MTRTGRVLVALLLALYVGQCLHYIASTSLVEGDQRYFLLWDDAMISMQYARNLRNGDGLVWNAGGEHVQGFTNPGVTLIMAALHVPPLEPAKRSLTVQLLALAMLAATLVVVLVRGTMPTRQGGRRPSSLGSAQRLLRKA